MKLPSGRRLKGSTECEESIRPVDAGISDTSDCHFQPITWFHVHLFSHCSSNEACDSHYRYSIIVCFERPVTAIVLNFIAEAWPNYGKRSGLPPNMTMGV